MRNYAFTISLNETVKQEVASGRIHPAFAFAARNGTGHYFKSISRIGVSRPSDNFFFYAKHGVVFPLNNCVDSELALLSVSKLPFVKKHKPRFVADRFVIWCENIVSDLSLPIVVSSKVVHISFPHAAQFSRLRLLNNSTLGSSGYMRSMMS